MAEVLCSERARDVLERVREREPGRLTISIDTGCCEGTAPHLYSDYVLPYGSTEIGTLADIPLFVPPHLKDQYESARILIDAIEDEGSDALSLETRIGMRLVMRHLTTS